MRGSFYIFLVIFLVGGLGYFGTQKPNNRSLNTISPSAGQSVLERIINRREIRCGYINYPPYFNKDVNTGKVSGLMVDIMNAIGTKLDLKITWAVETSWGTMIEDLKSSRFDAVCSSVWQNPARAKHALFSDAVTYAPVYAYVHHQNTDIKSLSDLNSPDIRISTIDGEINHFLATELFPKAKLEALPQTSPFSDVILNIATKKADVVFLEPNIADDFMASNPNKIKRLKDPIRSYPVVIMMKQNAYNLKNAIDAVLYEITTAPGWKATLSRHNLVSKDIK